MLFSIIIFGLLLLLSSSLATPYDEDNEDTTTSTSQSTSTLTDTVIINITQRAESDVLDNKDLANPNTPTLTCPHPTESCTVIGILVYPKGTTSLVIPGTPNDIPTFTYDPDSTSESLAALNITDAPTATLNSPASTSMALSVPTPTYSITRGTSTTINTVMAQSFDWPIICTTAPTSPPSILPPPPFTNATLSALAMDCTTLYSKTTAYIESMAWGGADGAVQYAKRSSLGQESASAGRKRKRSFWRWFGVE
ncbi:hypothetical protein J1614_011257 [Plenodomus biglobosus]|nr:hypothetical protein J1614_011257 [Plenodomus biglobosus]